MKSENTLKERLESLQKYLSIVEQQGLLPETKAYHMLLKSVKRLTRHQPKQTCFISYAWNPDQRANTELQNRLENLQKDLSMSGVTVLLDILTMQGDINHYMVENIAKSDRVLLICTPRLVERAEEPVVNNVLNNLQIEMEEMLKVQKLKPNFIIPIIMEGTFATAVPKSIQNSEFFFFNDCFCLPIFFFN